MDKKWQDAYEEAIRCIRCGYCQPTCPTYVITGIEHSVARGRNYLARLFHEKDVEISKDYKDPIFECLLCGACNTNCAPVVKTQDIMMAARAEYIKRMGQPPLQKFVFPEFLPNPERMTRLMKLASLGKRSGLSGLAQALRVFGWFGKGIANMEGLLETFPKKFLRERLDEVKPVEGKKKERVGYFVGCGINYAFPNVGIATINLLIKMGFSVDVLDNYCCGLPASGYGDVNASKMVAKRNIEIFEKSGCDVIVSDCGSCSSFITDYKHLLSDDNDWAQRAEMVSRKMMDINSFLTKFNLKLKLKTNEKISITYHDPCHLSHYLKITEEPRKLIKNIDGVEFKEMVESDWCCGGAGSYNIAHNDLSMKILNRKMTNLTNTEATILLSSCPGCLIQLSYGVRKYKLPVTVMHITELLNEAFIK